MFYKYLQHLSIRWISLKVCYTAYISVAPIPSELRASITDTNFDTDIHLIYRLTNDLQVLLQFFV